VLVPTILTSQEEQTVDGDAYSFDDDSDSQPSSSGSERVSSGATGGAHLQVLSQDESSSSYGRKTGSKLKGLLRGRSGSVNEEAAAVVSSSPNGSGSSGGTGGGTGGGAGEGSVKNSLSGLIVPARVKSPSSASGLSPFSSPATLRKKKALKKRGAQGVGSDEGKLWAPALVLPQVLGLLHFMTVLRHTLKHARLENRVVMETTDVDAVLANCVFEYSKLAKQAGLQLLLLAVHDPSNPEVGALGLAIANAGVLVTKSCLQLMNIDRQILRGCESSKKSGSSASSSKDVDNDSSGGRGGGGGGSGGGKTPKTKRKQRLQKTGKDRNLGRLNDLLSPRDNPLAAAPNSDDGDGEDSHDAES